MDPGPTTLTSTSVSASRWSVRRTVEYSRHYSAVVQHDRFRGRPRVLAGNGATAFRSNCHLAEAGCTGLSTDRVRPDGVPPWKASVSGQKVLSARVRSPASGGHRDPLPGPPEMHECDHLTGRTDPRHQPDHTALPRWSPRTIPGRKTEIRRSARPAASETDRADGRTLGGTSDHREPERPTAAEAATSHRGTTSVAIEEESRRKSAVNRTGHCHAAKTTGRRAWLDVIGTSTNSIVTFNTTTHWNHSVTIPPSRVIRTGGRGTSVVPRRSSRRVVA